MEEVTVSPLEHLLSSGMQTPVLTTGGRRDSYRSAGLRKAAHCSGGGGVRMTASSSSEEQREGDRLHGAGRRAVVHTLE
ncbi:hypothetical protein FQA47_011594 [Oryzias melastigma]|uniref:Uncharacterized protein n=1 Tax=Oryzias melastigma TaxID=30732 RepID=A0A834FC12_ORYME|nr:hypothetical protein FQA47_011594 [Oryzias melastigma]